MGMLMTVPMPPVHPGVFLAEILEELQVSQAELAHAAGVTPMQVSQVVAGSRPMSADLALRLGKVLGQTPQYWLNLQRDHDLGEAQAKLGGTLDDLRPRCRSWRDQGSGLAR